MCILLQPSAPLPSHYPSAVLYKHPLSYTNLLLLLLHLHPKSSTVCNNSITVGRLVTITQFDTLVYLVLVHIISGTYCSHKYVVKRKRGLLKSVTPESAVEISGVLEMPSR